MRCYDRRSLIALRDAPVDYAVREVMESAVKMGRAVLDFVGDDLEDIERAEHIYREVDSDRLELEREKGDFRAGMHKAITQERREARKPG